MIRTAGVLDDDHLGLTPDRIDTVLPGKVDAALEPAPEPPVTWICRLFALCSSITTTVGSPGRATTRRQTRFWTGWPLTGDLAGISLVGFQGTAGGMTAHLSAEIWPAGRSGLKPVGLKR